MTISHKDLWFITKDIPETQCYIFRFLLISYAKNVYDKTDLPIKLNRGTFIRCKMLLTNIRLSPFRVNISCM